MLYLYQEAHRFWLAGKYFTGILGPTKHHRTRRADARATATEPCPDVLAPVPSSLRETVRDENGGQLRAHFQQSQRLKNLIYIYIDYPIGTPESSYKVT